MKEKVRKYELNNNISDDLLKECGFEEITYNDVMKYTLYKSLYDGIDLFLRIKEIGDNNYSLEISVFDEIYGCSYESFYNEDSDFPVLNIVRNNFNACMKELEEKGLLVEKKENKKTYTYK